MFLIVPRLSTRALAAACTNQGFAIPSRFLSSTSIKFNELATTQLKNDDINSLNENNLIDKRIVKCLFDSGFKNLTRVQAETIKPSIDNTKGLVARAKTGTGKTLAFGIPVLNEIISNKSKGIKAMIVAPTRDLALQISAELRKLLSSDQSLRRAIGIVDLIGGANRYNQASLLSRSPSIVVGTPGRLIDFLGDDEISPIFNSVKYLVLDEADRLLDIGFKEEVLKISSILNSIGTNTSEPKFKTLFFSATIDRNVLDFASNLMGKDFPYIDTVDKNEAETHEKIHQSVSIADSFGGSYVSALKYIQDKYTISGNTEKMIVFLPTVKGVDFFNKLIRASFVNSGLTVPVFPFHGKLTQNVRDRTVKKFREIKGGILVTSDVGARGMDFPKITDVVQIGVCQDLANYVHRIGRTARGGNDGRAILFLSKSEAAFVELLKKKGITFTDKSRSEVDESFLDSIKSLLSIDESLSGLLNSNLSGSGGFYSSVIGKYRLSSHKIAAELSHCWTFFGMPGKINLPRVVIEAFNLKPNEARELFDRSAPIDSFTQDKSDRRRDFFDKPGQSRNTYGASKFDRFGSDSGKGGFSKGKGGYGKGDYKKGGNKKYSNGFNSRSSSDFDW